MREQRMREASELFSGLSRIRRGTEWPQSVENEQAQKLKYPRVMTINTEGAAHILHYRKSRWHRMNMGEGYVRQRDLFCWIMFEKRRVGALHFVEFEPDVLIGNGDFFDTMDADYHADAHLAEVLCDAWHDVVDDVLAYGSVVEFRLAWMSPKYAISGLWAMAAEALLKVEFDERSILVMKAFPLEYEGRAPDGSPAHNGLMRRQAAMIRYYERLFGVDRFPGMSGAGGWLWRANPRIADFVPAPHAAIPGT
jgi:hypothetical protein